MVFSTFANSSPPWSLTALDQNFAQISAIIGLGSGSVSTNLAVGNGALASNATGDQNTAVGFNALASNTGTLSVNGRNNVAVGSHALESNITGTQNCAVGNQTQQLCTTGSNNVTVGNASLHDNVSGSGNVGVGVDSLRVATGSNNTAVGTSALQSVVANGGNTAFGSGALLTTTGASCTAIGFAAGKYETGSNAFYVDNQDRVNTAGDKANALMFGTFAASAALQRLQQNAVVTKPVQPAFLATATATPNVTGDSTTVTVIWGTEIYDQHSDFASNTFTAPVTGRYHFDVGMDTTGVAAGNSVYLLRFVCTSRTINLVNINPGPLQQGGNVHFGGSADVDMTAGDTATVTLRLDGTGKTVGYSAVSYFSGHLVA